MSDFGFFDFGSSKAEPHGIFTRELDEGIKGFQSENGLQVDGVLKPKGETENALRQRIVAERKEPDTPEEGFIFVPKREREFDATGRRIVERGGMFGPDMLRLSEKYKPRPFTEEEVMKKLKERQVRLAAAQSQLERKNTVSDFRGLKIKKMMEQQENQPVTYEPGGDKHQWGIGDWMGRRIESAWGTDPTKTKLRKFKDGWIKDKKEVIKKTAEKHNLPPEMLAGIAWMEAGGQPDIGHA